MQETSTQAKNKPSTNTTRVTTNPIYKTLRPIYGNITKSRACDVCRTLTPNPMFHKHHSTKYMYNTLLARQEHSVNCPSCKKVHPIDLKTERITILMSSSTLHNCFLYESVKDDIHVNLETISGGTIDLLRASWNQLYYEEKRPMNVIVIAGLNDIATLDTDKIIHNICLFKRNVLEQNSKNVFLIAGLLRPPKLAWFEANGPEPIVPFRNGYKNHIDKIDEVNGIIFKLNSPLKLPTFMFANMGTRTLVKKDKTGKEYRVTQHQFSAWREYPNQAFMLHLNDIKRANMYNKVIKYIEANILPIKK